MARAVAGGESAAPAEANEAPTRERILDVALELFTERGFDGTTLREIAERLGFTRAALYYHYPSKEDIFMALHLRMHEVGKQGLKKLTEGPVNLETWESLLDSLLGQMLAQRKLFLLHERNQAVLERFHRQDHEDEHADLQSRFRQILRDPAISLRDRIRMAASLGALFSVLFLAGDSFEGEGEVEGLVRDAIHELLQREP